MVTAAERVATHLITSPSPIYTLDYVLTCTEALSARCLVTAAERVAPYLITSPSPIYTSGCVLTCTEALSARCLVTAAERVAPCAVSVVRTPLAVCASALAAAAKASPSSTSRWPRRWASDAERTEAVH